MYMAMQYLPLRDLSAMALVSKSCRNAITIDMVVRAAYFHTGDRFNTKKSMEELHKLMCANSIHVISPLRLLRIATGNKCEFCFREHKTLQPWSYGVYACWNCISEGSDCLTKCWNTKWVRYGRNQDRCDAVMSHPRNAISNLYGRKYYVWGEHRSMLGESIGPIMAWDDIDAAVEFMDGTDDSDEHIEKIDEYIEETLNAPAPEEYNEFNRAYLAAKTELEERAERDEREKAERRLVREERKRKREAEQQVKEERKRKRETAQQAKEAAKKASAGEEEVVEALAENVASALPEENSADVSNPPSDSIANVQDQPDKKAAADGNTHDSKEINTTDNRPVCAACNTAKKRDQYSKSQLQNRGRFARCKRCVLADAPAKHICSSCRQTKEVKLFSKTMQKSAIPIRCKHCCESFPRGA